MIAVKRLQSLFWVMLVALGALGAYLVSLRVATERNELMQVRAQIAAARSDIRYLETEFSARSSLRQLERWNAEDFRYSALTAEHYLDGERALAHLDGVEPNGPAFVAPPVLMAAADTAPPADQPVASPAALQIRSDEATIRTAQIEDMRAAPPARIALVSRVAPAKLDDAPSVKRVPLAETPRKTVAPGAVARKAERMAMLDARLLDDRTLGELGRKAAQESDKVSR